MRKDLAKLTTEQERVGSSSPSKKYGGRVKVHPDPDHEYEKEYGGFRSSSRHRQYDHKSLTDVLNPLKGALRKNLGRPWDDVYSEFAQLLDRRSVAGIHIWGHFLDFVAINTYMGVDGKVYAYGNYSGTPYEVGHRYWGGQFYVHPYTKLLLHADTRKEPRKGYQPVTSIPVPGMERWTYRKINGIWFRCVVVKRESYAWYLRGGPSEEYFEEKRSCNKKEIAWIKTLL
jgi:hypothetical protein